MYDTGNGSAILLYNLASPGVCPYNASAVGCKQAVGTSSLWALKIHLNKEIAMKADDEGAARARAPLAGGYTLASLSAVPVGFRGEAWAHQFEANMKSDDYDAVARVSKLDVSWDAPSPENTTAGWRGNYINKNESTYADAMPLGNGDVAAMAWANVSAGGVGCYVRKADAMSNVTKLLTLALLQVSLTPNPFAGGHYFNQTLSLSTASVVLLAGGSSFETHRVRLEILVDAVDNVVFM